MLKISNSSRDSISRMFVAGKHTVTVKQLETNTYKCTCNQIRCLQI